jgi:hypothetical protein
VDRCPGIDDSTDYDSWMGRRPVRIVMTLWLLALFLSNAQGQSQIEERKISPIRRIYVEDQRDRGVPLSDAGELVKPSGNAIPAHSLNGELQRAHDAARRDQVRALLASGSVTTAQDFHDAAFILQHGDKPDDYLLAHILAIQAIAKGDSSSVWISAATLDRYLQFIGQKQVFGTQFLDDWTAYYYQHRNDPDLNERLKTIRDDVTTQDPYDSSLLSDAIREAFCVPNLASQKKLVTDMNHGKPFNPAAVPGCHQ